MTNNPPQFQDPFYDYFEYVKDTESPLIYHRWSYITAVGAFLGRQFWFPFGSSRIFPNMYTMLIGNPGTRKSSAIKTAAKVMMMAGFDKFAAEKTTKEKFLMDLQGVDDELSGTYGRRTAGNNRSNSRTDRSANDILKDLDLDDSIEAHDGIPREVFITADEFNEFVGSSNLDFLSMLGALWDWDSETSTYKHRFKNSQSLSIFQPTISILAGNTHSGFQQAFPEAAIGQGFLSRLLLVYSEPSGKKITFPKKPDERVALNLQERLHAIRETVKGEATFTTQAGNALDAIYRSWNELDDYRFKSYSTRRFTHLLKLCLIVCAMRCSTRIDIQDVLLGNTILTFTETGMPKALGEYGRSRNSQAAHILMTTLYEAAAKGDPLPREALWKAVRRDLEKPEQLVDLLRSLQEAGKIMYVKNGSVEGFLPKNKQMNSKALYVDMKLLKEYQ